MDTKALRHLSYGLYVICSRKGDQFNGQITNTVIQVCSEPPTISVCINKDNLTHEFIKSSGVFAVSVLAQDAPLSFIGRFGFKSGRDINKFDGVNYKVGETRAPVVLEHTLAYLEARVLQEVDAGTHTIFLGELVDAEVLKDGEPMTYAHYHLVKQSTIPKAVDGYNIEKKGEIIKMASYRCTICGYVYDPERGDPKSGIEPGTPFEELPDYWKCPVCGASKDEFEKETS